MNKLFFLMFLLPLLPKLSYAQTCAELPDCEKLGYQVGYNAACGTDDSRYILCPYNTNYRKCIQYDCAKMGFINDSTMASWCEEIITCKFDENYKLCAKPKQ